MQQNDNEQVKIDWSVAPEGAMFFSQANDFFYKIIDGRYFYHHDGDMWTLSIHPYEDKSFVESLIPRPQEANTAPYIDWSKAPDGTTHVVVNSDWKMSSDGIPGCASQWEKHKDNECYEYCAENNEWQFFAYADNLTKEGMSWRIARPVELTESQKWEIDEALSKPVAATPINEDTQRTLDYLSSFKKIETNMDSAIDAQPHDPVNNPKHYTSHPSGIDCIQVVEHMNFCIGNAIKYLWRADLKNDAIEDLKKARWYVDREIARRENME